MEDIILKTTDLMRKDILQENWILSKQLQKGYRIRRLLIDFLSQKER